MSSSNLPRDWRQGLIGEVASFAPRVAKSLIEQDAVLTFVPMPAVEEVSGRIDTSLTISASEGKRRNLTYFEDGDVIFAKITPCMENGKIALAHGLLDGAAFGSTEFHVLRPGPEVLGEYLRLFLVQDDFRRDAERHMTGAVGQRRVPRKFLEESVIPLPPLEEQRAIVEVLEDHLSRLDAALSTLDVARLRARELRLRLIEDAVCGEWPQMPLGNVVGLRNGVFVSRPSESPPGVPIFRISAVRPMELDIADLRYADKAESEVSDYFVSEGDLLLTRYSGNPRFVGACAVVGSLPTPVLHPDKLIRGRVNRSVADPWFLAAYLTSDQGRAQVENRLKTTAGQVGIAGGQLKTVLVPVPPLDIQQQRIAAMRAALGRLQAANAAVARSEKIASAVRRSLLAAAFRGDLTRGWRERHG